MIRMKSAEEKIRWSHVGCQTAEKTVCMNRGVAVYPATRLF